MPRKPSLGPPMLRIEGLSDGIDLRLTDEFNGEVLPQPNARPPMDAKIIQAALKQAKVEAAREVLRAAKFTGFREHVPLIPKGKHISGTLTRKDGTVLHILKDNKPWRRV